MFIVQYKNEYDNANELVTKVFPRNLCGEIFKLDGYSDYNGVCDLTIFHTSEIGVFEPCSIVFDHFETVDDFGHRDIWSNIVNENGEVLATGYHEEH